MENITVGHPPTRFTRAEALGATDLALCPTILSYYPHSIRSLELGRSDSCQEGVCQTMAQSTKCQRSLWKQGSKQLICHLGDEPPGRTHYVLIFLFTGENVLP